MDTRLTRHKVTDMDLRLHLVFIGSFCMVTLRQGLSYMVQNGSTNVRDESVYTMETLEISCTRLPCDLNAGRIKYTLKKDNKTIFILGKNREDNQFSCSHHVNQKPSPCLNISFSMNETYISFKLRNVTLQDAGQYLCIRYSPGIYNVTSEKIHLKVLERPTIEISDNEALAPSTNSSYSSNANSTQATKVTNSTGPKGKANHGIIAWVVCAAITVAILIVL